MKTTSKLDGCKLRGLGTRRYTVKTTSKLVACKLRRAGRAHQNIKFYENKPRSIKTSEITYEIQRNTSKNVEI